MLGAALGALSAALRVCRMNIGEHCRQRLDDCSVGRVQGWLVGVLLAREVVLGSRSPRVKGPHVNENVARRNLGMDSPRLRHPFSQRPWCVCVCGVSGRASLPGRGTLLDVGGLRSIDGLIVCHGAVQLQLLLLASTHLGQLPSTIVWLVGAVVCGMFEARISDEAAFGPPHATIEDSLNASLPFRSWLQRPRFLKG